MFEFDHTTAGVVSRAVAESEAGVYAAEPSTSRVYAGALQLTPRVLLHSVTPPMILEVVAGFDRFPPDEMVKLALALMFVSFTPDVMTLPATV